MKNNIKKVLVSCVLATTMLFSYAAAGCQFIQINNNGTSVTSSSSKKPGTNSSSKKPGSSSTAKKQTFKVTFDFRDDSRPTTKNVREGNSLDKCETPADRHGYSFVGWAASADASASDVISFPYTPTGDVTFYAVWEKASFTVTFDKNFAGSEAETVEVEFESTVEAPETDPTRDGFVFQGWMDKAEEGEAITFPYQVKDDVTFYASWISEQTKVYTVSFDYNYDGAPAEELTPLKIVDGGGFRETALEQLTRPGYKFVGWNTDKNATKKMNFPYKPKADTVLYAIWQKEIYSVKYAYNMPDATGPFAQYDNLSYGDDMPKPTSDPTRPGHTFLGWYTTSLGGTLANLNVEVTESANYYAHWKADAVTTDTFQAELTEFDPLEIFPGYSGAAQGTGTITREADYHTGLIIGAKDYPTNSTLTTVVGHFVTYMYKKGATITFKIYASAATTVNLSVNVATEFVTNETVAPTGANAWKVMVNGTSHNYTPFTISGELVSGVTPFQLKDLGSINLKAGENVIQFVTDNTTLIIGGTTQAFAPMLDCIKLTGGSASLSYHPVYDNLWTGSLV